MAKRKAALLRSAAQPPMASAGYRLSTEVGLVACLGDARRSGRGNARRPRAIASMRQRRLRSLRFRPRRLAPVLVGLCLTQPLFGCFVDTEHPDPELETADKYTYGPRQPYVSLPALDWWRNFRSGELTKLMELAQTANLDIAVAVAQIIQADAQVRVSGSPLLPSVTANYMTQRSRTSPASISPTTTTTRRGSLISDLHTANLSASYVLDFWGQTRATVLANEESAIASRFNREVVAITTEVAVANAYFQVLGAQDRLRIANNNLREANRVLQVIRERLAAGTASQLEIAQQESLVDQVKANIPPFVITEQQSRVALAVLVGRAPENFTIRGGNMYAVHIPTVTPGLPSDILNQRPDIRQAEAQLASANHSVESARAAFFPTIQLTGQNGLQSLALAALFTPAAWYWTWTAAVAQPVFDGFQRLGQLELEQGVQQQFLQQYRKSVLNAFSDVEQALIALQQETIRERLQNDVVRTARQAFVLSEQRLREGTVDLTTVIQIEQTLFTAEDLLSQIRLARLLAVVSLFQALGGGWPPLNAPPPLIPPNGGGPI
jgi:outer membrane protein, multidrug efflux system